MKGLDEGERCLVGDVVGDGVERTGGKKWRFRSSKLLTGLISFRPINLNYVLALVSASINMTFMSINIIARCSS